MCASWRVPWLVLGPGARPECCWPWPGLGVDANGLSWALPWTDYRSPDAAISTGTCNVRPPMRSSSRRKASSSQKSLKQTDVATQQQADEVISAKQESGGDAEAEM
ncbi:hypothetical protein HPB52_021944 [Rhipicephalus sanguineus]|uniref:Uncharacterized protein n=1 Tax=Rhipicephalus sanguineus TaxID=34632 RepID=A0A9D4Q802_RHISA|nr:hypothetical protein HPB52_021944 [Rhipicephalus sanguineus]